MQRLPDYEIQPPTRIPAPLGFAAVRIGKSLHRRDRGSERRLSTLRRGHFKPRHLRRQYQPHDRPKLLDRQLRQGEVAWLIRLSELVAVDPARFVKLCNGVSALV